MMDNTPKVPGPFSIIAEQLPKWWNDPGSEGLKGTVEAMVPQDAVDLGLMVAGGPGGKLARKAGVALMGAGASTDAQAGNIIPAVLTGMKKFLPQMMEDFRKGASRSELLQKYGLFPITHDAADVVQYIPTPTGAEQTSKILAGQSFVKAPPVVQMRPRSVMPLNALLDHPELYKQVPELADLSVLQLKKMPDEAYGAYLNDASSELMPRSGRIEPAGSGLELLVTGPNPFQRHGVAEHFEHVIGPPGLTSGDYSLLNHELNHALQSRARGSFSTADTDWAERIHEIAASLGAQDTTPTRLIDQFDMALPLKDMRPGDFSKFDSPNVGSPQSRAAARTFLERSVNPTNEVRKHLRKGYSEGGHVGMEHTRSSGQDASTQPLSGSALKALVRGWIAGTAGLPGDLEGLARTLDKYTTFNPVQRALKDTTPVLPTSDFYKEWLPGKQPGDEAVSDVGSLFGGVGATKPAALGRGALSRVAMASPAPRAGSLAAQRGVIKAPGGNWLSGSIEDALKGLKNPYVDKYKQAIVDYGPDKAGQYVANPGVSAEALNNWVDKKLGNYVRNDMATERDPIRALAEQGVLHVDPAQLHGGRSLVHPSGEVLEKLGVSDAAKTWENASDRMIAPEQARTFLAARNGETGIPTVEKNPWLAEVPPETPVYDFYHHTRPEDLGFDHLMDELRNAVDVNSGLPPQLRLKPEDLAKVSVPQAVQRVAQINQWRADQKAAADLAKANNAATVLHKDYPEKGYRWVELRKPSDLPEGWADTTTDGSRFRGPKGEISRNDPRISLLQDALKYEGDTMQHCVGRYCAKVADGSTRIYSLRDAKGRPHVTIEEGKPSLVSKAYLESLPDPDKQSAGDIFEAPSTMYDYIHRHRKGNGDFDEFAVKTLTEHGYDTPPPRILQIKGKQNCKPNDEYLPFVQDFVKSGKWSDVGDLQNTGFRRATDAWNPNEEKMIRAAGIDFPTYATQQEIDTINQQVWPGLMGPAKPPGFAEGGSVSGKAPTWQDAYDEFQKAHQAQYGIGIDRPWTQDEDAARAKQRIDQSYIEALKAYDPNAAPDTSVLGTDAQPNVFTPKPEKGGWLSQQLSNIGGIFRPVVQSVDDFGKDALKATSGTINQAAKLGSEATGGAISPDAAKAIAALAYMYFTGDPNGIKTPAEALTPAEIDAVTVGMTPGFTDAAVDSLSSPLFHAPYISGTGGATMSDAVMAQLAGNGSQIGMNAANMSQSVDEILNAADLSRFLSGQTSGLIGKTAASAAGPFGPVVNVGEAVMRGVPVGQAGANAVGSIALGKAVSEAAKQTGVDPRLVSAGANYGITGNAPQASDMAKTALAVYAANNKGRRNG